MATFTIDQPSNFVGPRGMFRVDNRYKARVFDNSRQTQRAFADLREGLQAWRLWGSLGWSDIRQRYARSVLGPLWLTLSMAILVLGLGFVYGGLFGMSLDTYLPYLGVGFIAWGLISTFITDGCTTFYSEAESIKQVPSPLSVYAYRVVWRTFLILLHNIIIYIGIAIYFLLWAGLGNLLLAMLGVMLICVNGFWVSLFLGIVSARFRDIPPIVTSFVQVAFFLTPIFWDPAQLPGRALIVKYNPLFYYLEIVRQPLLGNPVPIHYWFVVLTLTALISLFSLAFFIRYRRRIAYWV